MECIQALYRRNDVSHPSSFTAQFDDSFAFIEEPQSKFHSAAASILIRLPETASMER
jgi:hypothetical protein